MLRDENKGAHTWRQAVTVVWGYVRCHIMAAADPFTLYIFLKESLSLRRDNAKLEKYNIFMETAVVNPRFST